MKESVKLHMVCISSNNDRHPILWYMTPCGLADGHQPFQEPVILK